MSSTILARSEAARETVKARTVDMKFEFVVIPVADVDRAKRFYGGLGWRLDADFAPGDDWRVDPVHATGLRLLGDLRQERDRGGARLRPGSLPDRLRHRGRPQRAGWSRCRHQRGFSRRGRRVPRHGRALPVRAPPGRRAGSRASQLPLVRLVQRSGRQWLAAAGSHRAIARARGQRLDRICLADRTRERAAACGGRARRARKADRRPT